MKIDVDETMLEQVEVFASMLNDPTYSRDDLNHISALIAAKVLGKVRHEREQGK